MVFSMRDGEDGLLCNIWRGSRDGDVDCFRWWLSSDACFEEASLFAGWKVGHG